jgi:hypothetical protein
MLDVMTVVTLEAVHVSACHAVSECVRANRDARAYLGDIIGVVNMQPLGINSEVSQAIGGHVEESMVVNHVIDGITAFYIDPTHRIEVPQLARSG